MANENEIKLPYLLHGEEKLYLASDVSRDLGRSPYYITTKISRGELEIGEHYLHLSQSDINTLMSQNETFIWGRGRLKYFITESGIRFLESFRLVNPNLFQRLTDKEDVIRLKQIRGGTNK